MAEKFNKFAANGKSIDKMYITGDLVVGNVGEHPDVGTYRRLKQGLCGNTI